MSLSWLARATTAQPKPMRRVAICVLAGLSISGCGRDTSPNLVLISLDTTRQDHFSAYGYERNTTPNLAAFASDGIRFDLAYSASATTGPSHATLFTSLHPSVHGVVKNGVPLNERYRSLAEILTEREYQTAGIASSFVLDARFGFAQGFATYEDSFSPEGATIRTEVFEGHEVESGFDRRADRTTGLAIDWLSSERDASRPFFLFVHYFDPHAPYDPPEPYRERFGRPEASDVEMAVARYDEEIAFTDAEIGKLLDVIDTVGVGETTLVVIVGDHGEGLMQRGHMEHGVHIYEEAVRVPLLMRWPNRISADLVVKAPVGLVDLSPTILGLLGEDADRANFQGQDLSMSLVRNRSIPRDRPIVLFRRHYEVGMQGHIPVAGYKLGIRVGDWKLIVGSQEQSSELYNLNEDPGELRNVIEDFPSKAAQLATQLEEYDGPENWIEQTSPTLSDENLRRLRTLGYVR